MISYREKQLMAVQKMLHDNSKILMEEGQNVLSGNIISLIDNERFQDVKTYDELVQLAGMLGYDNMIRVTDLLSEEELNRIDSQRKEIDKLFSKKTSIVNKTDLAFLILAIILQVTKVLLFPYVAEHFDYGETINKEERLNHNDSRIKAEEKREKNRFKNKYSEKYGEGYWLEILFRTPPYDITKGSADIGINMGGAYHRMHTLGHDSILGWFFGTMNILTDVVTLNNFQSYKVIRKPSMKITPERISIFQLIEMSYDVASSGKLNLPASIFAQAQHLKSDQFTKLGLPIPILSTLNENFASELYKSNYDAMCFARDLKIAGGSFVVSKLIDIIIGLVHGLFRDENTSKELYEVRTRKILLVSNLIASTSTIINAVITSNAKNLDLGSLLNTITHLFSDVRFILKIKQEFIENIINEQFEEELKKLDIQIDI